MSGSHPTLQAKDPIARRPCPKRGKDMMISRIMPDGPGYELRTYECAGCGHDELVLGQSELTKSDYYRTKAEGCERKADTARDLETKAQLKDFAGQWRYMAAQAEQH